MYAAFIHIEDGYDLISNKNDRAPGHIEGHKDDPLEDLII